MRNSLAKVTDTKEFSISKSGVNWKWMICGFLTIAVVLAGLCYYQSTRFNAEITINDINVGRLTAEQALTKLHSTVLKNNIYMGQKLILNGKNIKNVFTDKDLSNIRTLQHKQWTFFPNSRAVNYSLTPINDSSQFKELEEQLKEKLLEMNKSRKAPKDAIAHLVQGKIMITKSMEGNQYDVTSLVKQFQKQEYKSEVYLNPAYKKPINESSPIVKKEEAMLQELAQRTVDYKVQDQVYSLRADELIKNAYLSKDMQYIFDTGGIKNKIEQINENQSTLNKNYPLRTHSGSVISVKGESYGWALDVAAESNRIKDAFTKGEDSLTASNIYGIGWNHHGIGYLNTTNNGIGDTYAEVSIKEQRIWLYKNGKLVVTTPVVTGWHGVNQDTPTGVWYIEYKQSPSILKGSEVGNLNYSVKVKYWAPFTLSGCGFHDASWRKNWSSTAYLTQGSGGCVNTPSSAMKTVYDNLSQNEPVVVY